jgi:hypothetical protein
MMLDYLTTTEAKEYVGNNADSFSTIAETVAAVSRLIDNYCGDFFGQLEDDRTFVVRDGVATFGPYSPLVAATSATAAYELVDPAPSAEPRPYRSLTSSVEEITVTGTWGWPQLPAAVKQACRLQVARVFKRQDSPLGVAGFGEFGVVRVTQLDPDVKAMLAAYRRGENAGIG